MYLMGSETLPSACYILSDESSIPFYSTSKEYKKGCCPDPELVSLIFWGLLKEQPS